MTYARHNLPAALRAAARLADRTGQPYYVWATALGLTVALVRPSDGADYYRIAPAAPAVLVRHEVRP